MAALAVALMAAGCGPEATGEPSAQVVEQAAATEALGTLRSTTPEGVEIALSMDPDPPRPGAVRLRIELPQNLTSPVNLSVDVLAPQMPAHGIKRYPMTSRSGHIATTEVRIPMEGRWAIYVNLDRGTEAAPFQFEVAAGKGESSSDHDAHPDDAHQDDAHHHDAHH